MFSVLKFYEELLFLKKQNFSVKYRYLKSISGATKFIQEIE
jgi:hypothetical protein